MSVEEKLSREFQIPNLGIPDSIRISRHREFAENEGVRWAWRQGLITNGQDEELYRRHKWGTCAALTATTAPAERVALHAEWLAWNGAIDDIAENAHNYPLRWTLVADGMASCLLDAGSHESNRGRRREPALTAFGDLIGRTLPLGTPGWGERFTGVFLELMDYLAIEQKLKASGSIPDVDTYTRVRRTTGYMPLLYCLQEVILGAEICPAVLGSEIYQRLINTSTDAIDFVNDVYSLSKELARDEVSNIVIVINHQLQIGLDRAMYRSAELIRGNLAAFHAAERELPEILDAMNIRGRQRQDIAANVAGMHDWIAGLVQWYRSSSRYLDPVERIM